VTVERPTSEQVVGGYDVLFDPVARAAQRAVLEYAAVATGDRWPTPDMIAAFATLYDVPAAELGAFFGLLSYRDAGRTVWVDAVRGPTNTALAVTRLSREQAIAFGFLKCAMD
jgi:hypothetical protein